jgi:catechol 2,3-dioxygenase-like lactoylglutathione lyase family enzyme
VANTLAKRWADSRLRAASVTGGQQGAVTEVVVDIDTFLLYIDVYQYNRKETLMGRLQLAIDVSNLEESIDFYSRLFATPPTKVRPGYANFSIADPPLKLVLFEDPTGGGTINHLGVEVETAEEVATAEARITGSDLTTTGVAGALCCYAEKTETWIHGPDETRWEWYVKTGDNEQFDNIDIEPEENGHACCS